MAASLKSSYATTYTANDHQGVFDLAHPKARFRSNENVDPIQEFLVYRGPSCGIAPADYTATS